MARHTDVHSGVRRITLLATALLALAFPAGASADAAITSSGPLTSIGTTSDLNCSVNHASDLQGEWFADTACATLVASGGTLYGPASIPAGGGASPLTAYTPVSQSPVTGAGTSNDPYKIITVVDLGTSGLRLTQTDTYVVGEESYRTDVQLQNTGNAQVSGDHLPRRGLLPGGERQRLRRPRPDDRVHDVRRCRRRRRRRHRSRHAHRAAPAALAGEPLTGVLLLHGVGDDRRAGGVRRHLHLRRGHRQRHRAVVERDHPGRRLGHPLEPHVVLTDGPRPADHDQDRGRRHGRARRVRRLHDHDQQSQLEQRLADVDRRHAAGRVQLHRRVLHRRHHVRPGDQRADADLGRADQRPGGQQRHGWDRDAALRRHRRERAGRLLQQRHGQQRGLLRGPDR